MSMPGFTAEASLYGGGRHYMSPSYTPASVDRIVPAQNWGGFQRDGCTAIGLRQHSAILWNIPWGKSWEDACRTTPATIDGQSFSGAARCVNAWGHMWGQFDVQDPSCPHWGPLKNECRGAGARVFSAVLWDIPWGLSWEKTCAATPATENPVTGSLPNSCIIDGFTMWGEWNVTDHSCCVDVCDQATETCSGSYPTLQDCWDNCSDSCVAQGGFINCCSQICTVSHQNCG
jgi:hypothetical protein